MATFLSLTFIPIHVNASASDPTTTPAPVSPAVEARVLTLESRLKEIDAMDKSELKAADKKNLRKEVKAIKHELNTYQDGIYLTVGALIVILLVVIILV